jgi:hypothetical protein
LKDKLFVVLKATKYQLNRHLDEYGAFTFSEVSFNDEQKAHNQFWNKYERPPREEYWDYIVERRDLLVPQDVRERKGSFFTPQIWVELSQKYLTDVLGENWQDEYYIWDCAAGTGNLLNGLTNKYNIWASTLDKQDVEVMKDRIKNGANLLEDHVFQFDFLNDEFSKLPKRLQDIINNPEKRKKLVMYINPPYAEATTAATVTGTGKNKSGVATDNKINKSVNNKIGMASNEIFALFMAQVYDKIPEAKLGLFSKLKFVQGSNFAKFKEYFLAKYLGGFVVPANTFDNVKGSFPIGFTIWDFSVKIKINNVECDVYDNKKNNIGKKSFYGELPQSINKWMSNFQSNNISSIATLFYRGNDFQNQKYIYLAFGTTRAHDSELYISAINIIPMSIYLAVRHCIEATWLNDRDQFLYPNDGWKEDKEFQNDCLAFTLFYSQNRITSKEGTNHWIPFTEQEVNAREKFDSNFMTDFRKGKIKTEEKEGLFNNTPNPSLRGENEDGNTPAPSLRGESEDGNTPNPSLRGESEDGNTPNPSLRGENEDGNTPNPSFRRENEETSPLLEGIRGVFSDKNIFPNKTTTSEKNPMQFSTEAAAVFDAGRELWKYYHSQQFPLSNGDKMGRQYNVNASLYDIREYFQGRNEAGKMNNKSSDVTYMKLISSLRENLKILTQKIEPKVYEYGFLKE